MAGRKEHSPSLPLRGRRSKINTSASELVTLAPEVIYAQGLPATRALYQRTHTIPIVFTQVADPFGFGLVDSEAHPGGIAVIVIAVAVMVLA
jgi:ABC-type uncharacterized transport system substrate-binding protein